MFGEDLVIRTIMSAFKRYPKLVLNRYNNGNHVCTFWTCILIALRVAKVRDWSDYYYTSSTRDYMASWKAKLAFGHDTVQSVFDEKDILQPLPPGLVRLGVVCAQ